MCQKLVDIALKGTNEDLTLTKKKLEDLALKLLLVYEAFSY